MDNRSKVIGVAVVVAVVVSIIFITLIVRNRNSDLYATCKLGDAAPTVDGIPANVSSLDNSTLLYFSGFVEYPAKLPVTSDEDKATFVSLVPSTVSFSNNILELQADCGKLIMTQKEENNNKFISSIELEAFSKNGTTKCNLQPSVNQANFFSVAKDKHYKCLTEFIYSCEDAEKVVVSKLHINKIEFETNRPKDSKPYFVTPKEDCNKGNPIRF